LNAPERAVSLVQDYLEGKGQRPHKNNVKVVWFCKTLQNWKAIVADLSKGGVFFEVTYNGSKSETYVDAYKKIENVVVADE